jgi:hypothetical protein
MTTLKFNRKVTATMAFLSLFESPFAMGSQLSELLQKPLIAGASISADYGTQSPGKRLALKFTSPQNIRTMAESGKPARETLNQIQDSDFHDRTIVIAIDLFFWDSLDSNPKRSLEALHKLVGQVKARGIPLVLGDIPEIVAGFQPGRPALNKAIAQACADYSKCHVMPFDQMHRDLMKIGFVEVNGHKLSLHEIVPDGLHLSSIAADFLCEKLKSLL